MYTMHIFSQVLTPWVKVKKDIQDYWEHCLIVEVQSKVEIKVETLILRAIKTCHGSRSPANQGAKN